MATNSTTTTTTTTTTPDETPTMPQKLSNMYAEAKRRIPPLDRASSAMSSKVNTIKSNSQCALNQARDVWAMQEVKQVRSSFCTFMMNVGVVIQMAFSKTLGVVENFVGVEKDREGEEEDLMERVIGVVSKCWDKVEARERKVEGTWEEKLYVALRYMLAVVLAIVSMLVDFVSKYQGPGKEVVGDIADKVQKIMPTPQEDQNGDVNPAETVGVIPGSPEYSDNNISPALSSPSSQEHSKME